MIALFILLALSVAGNLYQHNLKKKDKKLTVDARQLLHDLTAGGAIVRVSVIDPDGLMIYRGGA